MRAWVNYDNDIVSPPSLTLTLSRTKKLGNKAEMTYLCMYVRDHAPWQYNFNQFENTLSKILLNRQAYYEN